MNAFSSLWRTAFLLCALLAACPSVRAQSVAGLLQRASSAEASGHYSEAAQLYEQFLKTPGTARSPARAGVKVRLAKDYFLLHRYQDSLNLLSDFRSGASHTPTQVLLIEGLDYLGLNRLPEAVKSLKEVLAADPESGTARMALADANARGGRLQQAARLYNEQLRSTPKLTDAWYKLSVVYLHLSRKSIGALQRQHPDDPVARQAVAESLLAQGDYWQAARMIFPLVRNTAASSTESSADRRFQPGLRADLGTALLQLDFVQAADKEFRLELRQDPECPKALLGIAESQALLGNWQSGLSAFEHLVQFHPTYLKKALENQPAAPLRKKAQSGKLAMPASYAGTRAGRLWKTWVAGGAMSAVDLKPSSSNCDQLSAARSRATGFWLSEPCYTRLRHALKTRKTLTEKEQLKLAETAYRLGDYRGAVATAEKVLESSPGNSWATMWLTKSYDALSDDCLLKLSSLNPKSAHVHEILARNYAGQSRWKQAIDEYNAAIQIEPNSPEFRMGLGTVYWQAGEWQQAAKVLQQVLGMSPQSAVAAYELGDCYIQMQQWEKAMPYLRRLQDDPSVGTRARLDLAKAESETGQLQAAVAILQTVLGDDHNGSIHYRLAVLYRKTGDQQKARQMFAASQKLRAASLQLNQQQAQVMEKEREDYERLNQSGAHEHP